MAGLYAVCGGRCSLALRLPASAPGPRSLLKMAVPGSKLEVHLALAGVFYTLCKLKKT